MCITWFGPSCRVITPPSSVIVLLGNIAFTQHAPLASHNFWREFNYITSRLTRRFQTFLGSVTFLKRKKALLVRRRHIQQLAELTAQQTMVTPHIVCSFLPFSTQLKDIQTLKVSLLGQAASTWFLSGNKWLDSGKQRENGERSLPQRRLSSGTGEIATGTVYFYRMTRRRNSLNGKYVSWESIPSFSTGVYQSIWN